MRRISNLRAIVLSIFSRGLYRDVARNWQGAGIVYLLIVNLLCAVPVLIGIQAAVSRFARKEAGPILDQIPPTVVHDGRVSAQVAMPWVIRSADGRAIAILDTTGRFTSLDSTEATVLVTATQLVARKSTAETQVFDLSRIKHFELNRDKVAGWLRLLVGWFALAMSPIVLCAMFLLRLFQVVVFAGVGMLLAGALRVRLPFAALMRLAAVAFTPMLLLDILRGAWLHVPQWRILSMVLALAYLVFAIQANREPDPASEGMAPPEG